MNDSVSEEPWTHSSEYLHQCLVRWVIRYRIENRQAAIEWLNKRKDPELADQVREQWAKGNRGNWGDWR